MKRLVAVALLLLAACSKERISFEDLLESTYDSLRRGDLEATLVSAENGRKAALKAGDMSWEWAFRVARAEVLVSQRQNAEVLKLLGEEREHDPAASRVRVRALMTRGVALCAIARGDGDWRRAIDDLDRAARLARDLESVELRGEVALRHGTCLFYRKDFDGADIQFRNALTAARSTGMASLEASSAGSLGLIRIDTGRYDEAAEWLRRSLAVATAIHADVPRAKTLQNLGWCYYNLGDFARALGFLAEAEALAARLHLTGDRLRALMNTGNSYYRQGVLGRAAENYSRALTIARQLDDRGTAATLLSNLGVVAFEQARHDEADALLEQAIKLQRALKDESGAAVTLLNQAHVQAARGALALAEASYREVISAEPQPGALWEAWSGLAVVEVKAGRPDRADAAFAKATAVMERSSDQLGVTEHRLTFFSSLRRFHDEHVDFLVGTGRTDEALLVADRGRARLLSESLLLREGEAALTVERYRELARTLDATLLFYWTAATRSFLWEVTPDAVAFHILPGQADIARRIEAYGADIQRSRDPLAGDAEDATWLYRVLVGPIASRSGRRIILVPDGPLHELNFETLIVPGPTPRYWIEDVTLATTPSLGLLGARATGRASRDRSLLVIGDPITPGGEFPPLAHAGREVSRIAELFPGHATVRSRSSARPETYSRGEPGRFAFIHFAAHATANRESPLDSAIVLSGPEDAYKLYARDVMAQPLNAELVTLSACRSAGSRTYAGEGLVVLAWAFLGSGARNVVGGLWNVEDVSTAELMEHLYRELRAGLAPMAALRAAKLRLIHSKAVTRKPYYWAPFVIYTLGG